MNNFFLFFKFDFEMNQAFDWRGLARGTFQGSKAVVEKKEG